MSDFSSKCREYLKNTGETVYQLSASSGLDRTSLQRMITGKRLPGMDFVRQFCDSIRINPSQRQELIELYKIEKIGKEIYYNRKYIQELLRVISTQQMLFSSGFHSLTSLPFYSGDFSLDVEKKVLNLFEDILLSGSDEKICTNIPANCRLIVQVSAHLYPEYQKLPPVMNCFRFSLLQKRNSCLFLLICQLSYLQKIRKLYIPISRNFRKSWKTPAVFSSSRILLHRSWRFSVPL